MTKLVKVFGTVMTGAVLLSGCNMFDNNAAEVDPPQKVSYVADKAVVNVKAQNMVQRELYLIDEHGYVVPQTVSLPKSDSAAKQVLEYLVDGGPVSNILPDGFRAVLPVDTEISVNLKNDGTAVVDFSKEFKNYKKEDEKQILQSITWTLTQFDNIKHVQIQMNGKEQKTMPVGGTPISESGLSRASGINVETSSVIDITSTSPVTLYFIDDVEGKTYYVPITRRISNDAGNNLTAIVQELIKGPNFTGGLLSDFQTDVRLLGDPSYENGKVTLNFNEAIYGSNAKNVISDHVLQSLVLSLTEQDGVESVAITVNGKATLVSEAGKKLTAPVTRPEKVNTGSF